MELGEVVKHCKWIEGISSDEAKKYLSQSPTMLDYFDGIKDVVLQLPKEQVNQFPFNTKDFALSLRKIRDSYEQEVKADPMSIYTPAHNVALEFHKSTAFIRYFRGGNRISKTESAAYDNYLIVTGQMSIHNWRKVCALPASVFVLGSNFSQYGHEVFEKKYLYGEPGNPLSPIFPEGGKWFHSYDPKKHIIKICCVECAKKYQAKSCKHLKSTVHLFSDEADPQVLAGGQYAQGQFDEHIQEEFFSEAIKRLETVPYANLMITHTPLEGKGAWEHQRLTKLFEEGPPLNLVPKTTRLYVSLHTIDQFSAGLSAPELVEASMKVMAPAEIEARVYGRPAAFSATGVFDAWMLSEMYEEVTDPTRGELEIIEKNKKPKEQAELLKLYGPKCELSYNSKTDGELRIWKTPERFGQYIIGADVAQGLTNRDASCASVFQLSRVGLDFHYELVAQYHGWVNSLAYGEELAKLGYYYNTALVVVERRGPGDATLHRLKELDYWNIFRDLSDPSQATAVPDALLGVDTNVKTKGILVSMLQNCVKDKRTGKRSLKVHCYNTLEEFGHFGQERTESKLSYRFRGEGGMHDDRVMACALAIYAAKIYPEVYDIDLEVKLRRSKNQKKLELSDYEKQMWSEFRKQEEELEKASEDPFYE